MAPTGVLLINVGTPDAPTLPAVRKYLKQFLTDPMVVSLPTIARYLLVYGLIVPFRTPKSTEAYKAVWDKDKGSPLLSFSRSFQQALQQVLGDDYFVELGMRYGNPNIELALKKFKQQNITKIIVAPLYPQNAAASTGSALAEFNKQLSLYETKPDVINLGDFYVEPNFIASMAKLIQPFLQADYNCVLFSYHGLPFDQVKKSEIKTPDNCESDLPCPVITDNNKNCYRAQCYATSRALAQTLNLKPEEYHVSFQSRVGMNRWIGPDTEGVLKKLIGMGKTNIVVACPSFVTDCLETIEEIGMRGQELWQSLGGESLQLVPCLNDHPDWVQGFADMVKQKNH
tara:strand:- start:54776 stop:55801 length:1026 start_codon:yes stop_codon:yes gene_type:complete